MITVGGSYQAGLDQEVGAQPVNLLRFRFSPSASVAERRFAIWGADVTYVSEVYTALPPVEGMDTPVFDQATPLTELFFRFSVQLDSALLADVQQHGRNFMCDWYLVVLLADGTPAGGEAIHVMHRRQMPGRIQGGATVYSTEMATESRFHRHRTRAPRTYSHSYQLQVDPTDEAFINAGRRLDISADNWRQRSGLR